MCRKAEGREDPESDLLCSYESTEHQRTHIEPSMDQVQNFMVEKVQNNSSSVDIKVSWTPPKSPNGGHILSYYIRYKKLDSPESSHFAMICVTGEKTSYLITKVTPGNYSVDMRVTTLAQEGNFTSANTIYIEDASSGGAL